MKAIKTIATTGLATAALAIGAAGVLATAPAADAAPLRPGRWEESATASKTKVAKAPPVTCPAGERFVNIKSGGLLFKKTHYKGCATLDKIEYYRAQAWRANQQRMQFAKGVNSAFQDAAKSIRESQPKMCSTSFTGSTAWTTCY